MYVGENESEKFRLTIMNGLKNRGVRDVLIASVHGLTDFPKAIEVVFPQTKIQQCNEIRRGSLPTRIATHSWLI
ncbi:MAG: transposase [Anaerotignum sp.]|nr:transposase [Anaerotignum sp.]